MRINQTQRKRIKNILTMKRCRYCLSTENLTIDHKVPLILGGNNEISNLQCLCKRCNISKNNISHKKLLKLFRWLVEINEERIKQGRKPLDKLYIKGNKRTPKE